MLQSSNTNLYFPQKEVHKQDLRKIDQLQYKGLKQHYRMRHSEILAETLRSSTVAGIGEYNIIR